MSRFIVRKVAVLGAGVMGAQIAAHCANAGFAVLLFDLPGEGGGSGPAQDAIERLARLTPEPLATPRHALAIDAANYDDDLLRLADCELVIEAIAERIELKRALFERIAPYVRHDAVIATNTSGLSVRELSAVLPEALRSRFCGVHFFNPPRAMALVELIAGPHTDAPLLDRLETWLTSRLGKSVVRAHDTPNFIANRIGMFALLAVMRHTERLGLGFDEADALTGPLIGRPRSATFRTADVVGLDTMAHVIGTLRERLPDDPWHPWFGEPQWLTALVARGALGAKSGEGVYRKDGKRILVLDGEAYRDSAAVVAPEVTAILAERDPLRRMQQLRACPHPQAELLWSSYRDLFHYAAFHLAAIAENAREVDLAMRWGFGWAQGPFETWQAAGWRAVAEAIADDIEAGRTMADVPLPEWVSLRDGVHDTGGSWSATAGRLQPRAALTVYVRQLEPERLFGEREPAHGEVLWENAGLRLWRRVDQDPRIGILSVTTKMHVIDEAVLDGIVEAVARAGRELDGLVIRHAAPFSAGADLKRVLAGCEAGEFDVLERMLDRFHAVARAVQQSAVPVVAAVEGQALGGGCELLMRAAHRTLAFESRIGLVEALVGLIPAGGGSAALAVAASDLARRTTDGDPLPFVRHAFTQIMQAMVSGSAPQAVELGYARESDDIVMHAGELLHVALLRARSLHDAGWHPRPLARSVRLAGREGVEACLSSLAGDASEHDRRVASAVATALCGGEVASGTLLDEETLLAIEREQCMALLRTPETQARIRHMLETGKALRN
ncbi:MAG: 3-hydroxyacyl-CoA dehydrogenase/enoyl-CoA hydratase family protein [Pseudazoarcus pumilus]|nr:3-hydroxyacyl-CoA dehydrogenase/enoyl-CoA hydratase family protein [Pseudazoarcus pumilus]